MLCPPNQCMACCACMNVCPKNAITMHVGPDGYYNPVVDETLCVNCGLCTDTCPQLKLPPNDHISQPACFACQADDEVRYHSSSGGMFTLLARYILSKGGIVFGSAYDDALLPHHIEISEEEKLPLLQKSKYTQSYTGYTFRRVKELLKQGKPVLFVGVPCQIGGLHAYLKKDDPNLYTVDLMCSGTSAVGVYQRYLKELEEKHRKKLRYVDFRNKDNGWSAGHSTLYYTDGTSENFTYDPFMRVFITAGMKAHACNQCNYAEFPRFSDLTIGDFWNIQKFNPALTDGKGTSLVTVNSPKGELLLRAVREMFPLQLDEPVDFFFTRGSNWFTKDRPMTDSARHFYELIKTHTVHESLDRVLKKRYDICCIGNWSGFNYGAHLTHYALYQVLTDHGYDVLMLEKPNEPPYPPVSRAGLFRQDPYPVYALAPLYNSLQDMRELNSRCQTFITGSDMLWNYENFGHSMDFYNQSFVDGDRDKIAYATSFGNIEKNIPETHHLLKGLLMGRFDHLSTREDIGVELAKESFGLDVEQVLDPVFLCDESHYMEMIQHAEKKHDKKFLFCYVLGPNAEKLELINAVARETGLEVVCVGDALEKRDDVTKCFHFVSDVKVEDWLYYLYQSELVIADSFHAYCFSIIFRKQVIPLYDAPVYAYRALSLSRVFQIAEPFILFSRKHHRSGT